MFHCLGNDPQTVGNGKHVIIVFSEEDDYYQYIAYYYPDGTHTQSGGCTLHADYVHAAVNHRGGFDLQRVVAHEIAHCWLARWPIPLWLNEGIATSTDRQFAPPNSVLLDHDLHSRHGQFWNESNIQEFWAGTSFSKPGEPVELSYNLAEILVKLLIEAGGSFADFVRQAHFDDGGQTASLNVLGRSLGDLVGGFLGEGDWRPYRKALVTEWETKSKLRNNE